MITPWGMYMKPRRTGGFSALAPDAAPPIDSRSGSDSAAPRPLRQVRRSRSNLLDIGGGCGWNVAVQEGVTGDDSGDERLHAVLIAHEGLHEAIHNDLIEALELPAQSVGQK